MVNSTIQASIQLPELTNQRHTKIMLMEGREQESQKQEQKRAREIYEQYQKLRKFYIQESEVSG